MYFPGGGAKLRFWANLDNWLKYGLKAVRITERSAKRGNKLNELWHEEFAKDSITIMESDTLEIIKYSLHSNKDVNGVLTKWLDSLKTKMVIKGSIERIKRKNDSIEIHNYNQRASSAYWLNQD